MSDHFITVAIDEDYLERLAKLRPITDEDRADAYAETLSCSDPAGCPGWIECRENHEGFDPEDEDSPACDQFEDVEIHGVLHDWQYGHDWVVDYKGCPVVGFADYETPDGISLDRPGKYLVEVEWEDDDCYLTLIREVAEAGDPR